MDIQNKKKVFYGWWIVAGCFSLCFTSIGIVLNSISIFFKPVSDALGFSRGDFTLSFAISAIAIMFFAPFIGKLYEKYDARIIVVISAFLLAASFASFAFCRTLLHFYLCSVVMGIGVASTGIIAVSVLITNWFVERRGVAMGIALSASGLGGVVYNPLGNWFLEHYGWQATYLFFGASIAILAVPAAFLIRTKPQDMGLLPYGTESTSPGVQIAEAEGMTLKESLSTAVFWIFALMVFFTNIVIMGVQMHIIPFLTDVGHSATFASYLMAATLGVLVVAKIIVGKISDSFGIKHALLLVFAFMVIGIGFFYGAKSSWLAVAAASFFAFGITIQTVIPPLMTAQCFGLRHFGVVYGFVNIFITLGSGLGTPLSGYIYDSFKSYFPAFHLFLVLTVISAALGLAAISRARYK